MVIMSSILTHNNRERHHSQTPVALVLPFLLGVSSTSVYWSDATNLASVSTEIRVLAQLKPGHDRRPSHMLAAFESSEKRRILDKSM